MKLSYKEKIEIYNEWKVNHKSSRKIAKERNLSYAGIEYMVHLADLNGPEILEHKWNYFSPEYKENAIKRVLLGKESVHQVSLDLGLATHGTLARWIKEYKENGYTVIERKRGRHAKEEKDNRRASGRERGTITAENKRMLIQSIRTVSLRQVFLSLMAIQILIVSVQELYSV
ncbi:MAG: transposase [Solobacterium sp.]|nr:transposase [Solobacterium sp.]